MGNRNKNPGKPNKKSAKSKQKVGEIQIPIQTKNNKLAKSKLKSGKPKQKNPGNPNKRLAKSKQKIGEIQTKDW
jgi:hypothetical protein